MNQEKETKYKFQVFQMLGEREDTSPISACTQYTPGWINSGTYLVILPETGQAFRVVPKEKKVDLIYGKPIEPGCPTEIFLNVIEEETRKAEEQKAALEELRRTGVFDQVVHARSNARLSRADEISFEWFEQTPGRIRQDSSGTVIGTAPGNGIELAEGSNRLRDYRYTTSSREDAVINPIMDALNEDPDSFGERNLVVREGYVFARVSPGLSITCVGSVLPSPGFQQYFVNRENRHFTQLSNSCVYSDSNGALYFRNREDCMVKINALLAASIVDEMTRLTQAGIRYDSYTAYSGDTIHPYTMQRVARQIIDTREIDSGLSERFAEQVVENYTVNRAQPTDRITRVIPERNRQQELQNRYRQQAHSRRR